MTNADPSLFSTTAAATAVDLGFDEQLAKHRLESANNDDQGGVQAISEADFLARIASFERREQQEAQRARRMMRRWSETTTTTTTTDQRISTRINRAQTHLNSGFRLRATTNGSRLLLPSSTFSDATDAEVDYFLDPSSDIDAEEDEWASNGITLPHLVYDPRLGYSLFDHEEHALDDDDGLPMDDDETLAVYPPFHDLYPMHSMAYTSTLNAHRPISWPATTSLALFLASARVRIWNPSNHLVPLRPIVILLVCTLQPAVKTPNPTHGVFVSLASLPQCSFIHDFMTHTTTSPP
ncbi:SubName: Full=Uncharacterized protein {ECO:0000313/EMBL:CCA67542.1} [Serendipita indica DSM 11827]|nr:SubName: Full=Uncharacterized protein {ECO:0000313/EMBL:CCA67542.1} [Serendipita indica DSM 11827]